MEKIAEGEWEDEIESELGDAIAEAIDDFGPDFDAEGNPIEEGESDRIMSEEEREREGRTEARRRRRRGRSGSDERRGPEREEARAGGRRAPAGDARWPVLKDIRGRIASVKNIRKITRAMEMVAAARLRRAEQRIEALRPYADAIRRMTARASEAAENIPNLPILQEREEVDDRRHPARDRGSRPRRALQLADHARRQPARRRAARRGQGGALVRRRAPRRVFARVPRARAGRLVDGLHRPARPSPTPARSPTASTSAYVDGKVDRVEIIYNGYISAVNQEVREETLLPLQQADMLDRGGGGRRDDGDDGDQSDSRALWIYEPDPEEILARLVPDYVEISIFRALLESTASEHGARMSAMRNASDNAGELIDDLTLAANRQRQAEITQEIMEVVAGAEGLR